MNSQEPLGLPKGSVRAILTLLVVFSAMALAVLACVGFEPPEYVWIVFSSALTLVLRDYFSSRVVETPVVSSDPPADCAKDDV
jgi:hypothetical protein